MTIKDSLQSLPPDIQGELQTLYQSKIPFPILLVLGKKNRMDKDVSLLYAQTVGERAGETTLEDARTQAFDSRLIHLVIGE